MLKSLRHQGNQLKLFEGYNGATCWLPCVRIPKFIVDILNLMVFKLFEQGTEGSNPKQIYTEISLMLFSYSQECVFRIGTLFYLSDSTFRVIQYISPPLTPTNCSQNKNLQMMKRNTRVAASYLFTFCLLFSFQRHSSGFSTYLFKTTGERE